MSDINEVDKDDLWHADNPKHRVSDLTREQVEIAINKALVEFWASFDKRDANGIVNAKETAQQIATALLDRCDEKENAALRQRVRELENILRRKGYQEECSIPACNCGTQWTHGGYAEARLKEIDEVLDYENGKTIIQRVELLKQRVEELEKELETERMRLAGCGVAALGYHKRTDELQSEYDSASMRDTISLYEKKTELEQQLAEVTQERDVWKENFQNRIDECMQVIHTITVQRDELKQQLNPMKQAAQSLEIKALTEQLATVMRERDTWKGRSKDAIQVQLHMAKEYSQWIFGLLRRNVKNY